MAAASTRSFVTQSATSPRRTGNFDKSRKFGLYSSQREVGVGRKRNSTRTSEHDRELQLGLSRVIILLCYRGANLYWAC